MSTSKRFINFLAFNDPLKSFWAFKENLLHQILLIMYEWRHHSVIVRTLCTIVHYKRHPFPFSCYKILCGFSSSSMSQNELSKDFCVILILSLLTNNLECGTIFLLFTSNPLKLLSGILGALVWLHCKTHNWPRWKLIYLLQYVQSSGQTPLSKHQHHIGVLFSVE